MNSIIDQQRDIEDFRIKKRSLIELETEKIEEALYLITSTESFVKDRINRWKKILYGTEDL